MTHSPRKHQKSEVTRRNLSAAKTSREMNCRVKTHHCMQYLARLISTDALTYVDKHACAMMCYVFAVYMLLKQLRTRATPTVNELLIVVSVF